MENKFITKTEFAYKEIKDKIGDGFYKKNHLYTIVDVANEIGVSRTPVSGAIKILESEGIVTLFPGVGFKIKYLTMNEIRESLMISGALEIVAMDYIIDNSNTDFLKKADTLLDYIKASQKAIDEKNGKEYVKYAGKYHETLYSMVDLPSVKVLLNEHTFLHKSWYGEGAQKFPELASKLVQDHMEIHKALINKDKKRIAEVVEEHEINCYHILEKVLKK